MIAAIHTADVLLVIAVSLILAVAVALGEPDDFGTWGDDGEQGE